MSKIYIVRTILEASIRVPDGTDPRTVKGFCEEHLLYEDAFAGARDGAVSLITINVVQEEVVDMDYETTWANIIKKPLTV